MFMPSGFVRAVSYSYILLSKKARNGSALILTVLSVLTQPVPVTTLWDRGCCESWSKDKKLKHREVMSLAQGHTAKRGQT